MTTNEILGRLSWLSQIQLSNGEESLSKDLKVKIMRMRINFNRFKKAFESDNEKKARTLLTEDFVALRDKENKTKKEEAKVKELADAIDKEYASYIQERLQKEEENVKILKFTNEEYEEIVALTTKESFTFNDMTFDAAEFLEIIYNLFVD